MINTYLYSESGLDNVILHNIINITDNANEEVIYIPKVNQLHKMISKSIITKTGKITSKELRFLRTEMMLKQSELSEILGKEAQAVGRWERGDAPIDTSTDILVRVIVKDYYKFDLHSDISSFSTWSKGDEQKTIDITIDENKDYQLLKCI